MVTADGTFGITDCVRVQSGATESSVDAGFYGVSRARATGFGPACWRWGQWGSRGDPAGQGGDGTLENEADGMNPNGQPPSALSTPCDAFISKSPRIDHQKNTTNDVNGNRLFHIFLHPLRFELERSTLEETNEGQKPRP